MADFEVLWADAARLDLEGIVEFIVQESPTNALTALARVEQRCRTLATLPERGRIVPELRAIESFKSYRKATLKLAPLTVLIGANASGKSNAVEALRLLSWLAQGNKLGRFDTPFRKGIRRFAER